MKNKKIAGSLPITRQRSTHSPSISNVSIPIGFTRPTTSTPTSNAPPLPASSSASQNESNLTTRRYKNWVSGSGRVNISEQLRLALMNKGPEYTYNEMKADPVGEAKILPPRRIMHAIRTEFGFGMKEEDRRELFSKIRTDITTGQIASRYMPKFFTNPNAITALRAQAIEWSKVEGNNIFNIDLNDTAIKEFFRELTSDIPEQHRQAALALIDQPPGYRQPLPGTIASQLPQSMALQSHAQGSASNQAQPVVQVQQDVYPHNANASSYPATLSVPSTPAKRSYSAISDGSTSNGNEPPTFKRSRPAYENQASQPSASNDLQSFSYGSTPSEIDQSNQTHLLQGASFDPLQPQPQPQPQPQQPEMPQTYNPETTDYQPHLFQDTSIDPLQMQMQMQSQSQSSSWSASNGMSQSTLQPQHQQPQMPQEYNSGNMNYQTDVFQGGQFFDPSHFQPTHYMQGPNNSGPQASQYSSFWSPYNEMNRPYVQHQFQPPMQPMYYSGATNYQPHLFQGASFYPRTMQPQHQMQQAYNLGNMNYQPSAFQHGPYFGPSQFQPAPYMQSLNNYAPPNFQNSQFNQGNAFQGTYTGGPLSVGQPNYSASGASPFFNLAATIDEWSQFVQTIDESAPIVPATYTQLTSAVPVTAVNNQTTSESTTATPTQQP